MSNGLPIGLHNGGVPMTQKIPTLQMVCISDSRQCNAGCSYCPSRGLPVKERLPLPDLKRVVDYFVAHTNRAAMKPRELSFVLNTLGEPTLGIGNVTGIADYVERLNGGHLRHPGLLLHVLDQPHGDAGRRGELCGAPRISDRFAAWPACVRVRGASAPV